MNKKKIIFFALMLIGTASAEGTGGIITYDGSYTIHTFISNDTFAISSNVNITYLIVAGGGSGGSNYGGGGGAGGLSYGSALITTGSYPIIVGLGGYTTGTNLQGNNGSNSSFNSIEMKGGGGGGSVSGGNGRDGGSGGGGAFSNIAPGQPFMNQGYRGGYGYGVPNFRAGGGGGAGSVGINGSSAPNGGTGITYNISGSNICYAGGGGGGFGDPGQTQGSGTCGGGNGGDGYGSYNGVAGTNGTGGGGGGGSGGPNPGGNGAMGGSGIVIIRYLTCYNINICVPPTISIHNNSKTNTSSSYGIFLDSGESITFRANTTPPSNSWNWYIDGILQSNNYNNLTTSWSSGSYHYVYLNTTNSYGTSNNLTWGINVFPAMAVSPGNNINLLNESPSQDLSTAIQNNDMPGIVNSPVKVYVNLIGLSFYAVIWFIVFGMLWIKQASINIPSIIGVIFGGILVTFLPAQYQLVSQALIVFGIFAAIYVFYKGRG